MRNPRPALALLALVAVYAGCVSSDAGITSGSNPFCLCMNEIATGLDKPVGIVNAGDGSNLLYILLQNGPVKMYNVTAGEMLSGTFADFSSRLSTGGEKGLLSLAFHPNFGQSGKYGHDKFYAYYCRPNVGGDGGNHHTVLSAFTVSADPLAADMDSEEIIQEFQQPYANHNGGTIVFDHMGMLILTLGDGGSGGDPGNRGQDMSTVLAKVIRVNVTSPPANETFTIPPDNPFVGVADVDELIYALGLRNPWRCSVDRKYKNRLYCGDVGQNKYEEVVVMAEGGGNYGWKVYEADHCYSPSEDCELSDHKRPIVEYPHSEGTSVTGGYVYRGTRIPELYGSYIFGDHGSGNMYYMTPKWLDDEDSNADVENPNKWVTRYLCFSDGAGCSSHMRRQSSFGEDEAGELYTFNRLDGKMYEIHPADPADCDESTCLIGNSNVGDYTLFPGTTSFSSSLSSVSTSTPMSEPSSSTSSTTMGGSSPETTDSDQGIIEGGGKTTSGSTTVLYTVGVAVGFVVLILVVVFVVFVVVPRAAPRTVPESTTTAEAGPAADAADKPTYTAKNKEGKSASNESSERGEGGANNSSKKGVSAKSSSSFSYYSQTEEEESSSVGRLSSSTGGVSSS